MYLFENIPWKSNTLIVRNTYDHSVYTKIILLKRKIEILRKVKYLFLEVNYIKLWEIGNTSNKHKLNL